MPEEKELDGWGQIAKRLGVSVRTAQMYERMFGLPVHRKSGLRGRVWATESELQAWKASWLAGERPSLAPIGPAQSRRTALSAKLSIPFAGHRNHVLTASSIYAFMLASTVFMEIAYAYNHYAKFAWLTSSIVLLGTLATTCLALAIDTRVTRSGRNIGLAASLGILIVSALINYFVVRPYLPATAVTQASFQTWTAQAAYLKGLVYCTAFAIVFLLVSFHFVIALQRQLMEGDRRLALELLTPGVSAVAPTGAPYLPVWLFGVLLLVGAVYSILSSAHLLEALKATEFTNLFIHLIQIRWILFLALGAECCWWYYAAINELRRECRASSMPLRAQTR